jgi:tRNA dimethylallyltransferase
LPVVVGGSMFYLRALLFPPDDTIHKPKTGRSFVSVDGDNNEGQSSEQLWHMLQAVDPDRAVALSKNDRYRIQRALQIWQETGVKPSLYKPQFQPLGNFHITFITRDRNELYQRIDDRVLTMFDQGWPAEVAALSPEWKEFLLQKKILGYPEILHMLEHEASFTEVEGTVQVIQQKTRNYAKRQITFWRSFKEGIEKQVGSSDRCGELNLTLSSVDLYLNHIQKLIDCQTKGLS